MTRQKSPSTSKGRRLHPLSLLFEIASIIRSNIVPTVFAIFGTSQGGWVGFSIGLLVILIGLAIALIRYFTFRYSIANNEFIVDQGLIHRLHRVIPLSRIQNIDLSQNVFHRLMRVGVVQVETASGKEPEAIMRVLALTEFARLKAEMLASNDLHDEIPQGIDSIELPSLSKQSEEPKLILALPLRLIVLAGLLSNRGEVIAGLALGFLWELRFGNQWFTSNPGRGIEIGAGSDTAKSIASDGITVRGILDFVRESYGAIGSLLLISVGILVIFAVLRIFSAAWYILRFYGYRLEAQGESLHVRCGLLTQVSATIPRGRVQLICVQRSWISRRCGLASIRIETAGGGNGETENAASSVGRRWFVPVLPISALGRILSAIDPRAQFDENNIRWQTLSKDALARMFRSLLIVSVLMTFAGVYLRPSWGWLPGLFLGIGGWFYARKKSKSKRYSRTEWGLIFRSGTWNHKCSMTFFEKIQSVSYSQSPFDRRWHMANLSIDTAAAGPADHRIQIGYLDSEFAAVEFEKIEKALPSHRG